MPQRRQQNREREENSNAFYLIKFKIEIKVQIFQFPFVQFWKRCEFRKREKNTHTKTLTHKRII